MNKLKISLVKILRSLEKYTRTDMVYFFKGSFWINANMIIVNLFSFILSILFARYLTKETYGTYQFILSISSLIGSLTLTGMNNAVTQAVARGYEDVFPRSVKLQIKYSFIPVIAGILGSSYYFFNSNATLSYSLIIIAILLPLSNAFNTWGAFLAGKKDFNGSFKYSQIINIIYYVGMVGTIFIFPNTIALVTVNFVINTLTNYFVYQLVINRYKPNNQFDEETLSFGTKLSVFSVLPMLALNIDNLAVFHLLGARDLAIYAFASNIPERMGSLLRPISIIALPKFSKKTGKELNDNINHKTLQLIILALVGSILYFFAAPFIYKIFFPQYTESILYSQIYTLVIVMGTAGNFVLTALSSTQSSNIFKFNIINPIINIIVIYAMTVSFGIWGAIFGKLLSNTFHLFISRYYLLKSN